MKLGPLPVWLKHRGLRVASVALLLGVAYWLGRGSVAQRWTQDPKQALVPSVEPPPPAVVVLERTFVAVVLPEQAVDLIAPVTATIMELPVGVGAVVRAGATLVRLRADEVAREATEAEALARQAEAEVRRAEAEAKDAKQRLESRQSEGVVSVEERQSAETRVQVTTANLDVARQRHVQNAAAAAKARHRLEQLTLRAPFDGVVAARYQAPGGVVQVNTRLLRFISSSQALVRFALPQTRIDAVKVGDVLVFRPDGVSDQAKSVAIIRMAPEADPHSGLVIVEAAFEKGEEDVKPGTVGAVELSPKG